MKNCLYLCKRILKNLKMPKRLTHKEFVETVARENPHDITIIGEYINNKTRIDVKCNVCGYKWRPLSSSILNLKSGCPQCHFKELHKTKTVKQFIEEARQVHGDKYDYSKVNYVDAHTKVCIICPEHGEFWQLPSSHLRGHGCQKCKLRQIANRKRLDHETFISKLNIVNPKIEVIGQYTFSNEKIKVKCRLCAHEWLATPNNLLKKRGCPACWRRKHYKSLHGNII